MGRKFRDVYVYLCGCCGGFSGIQFDMIGRSLGLYWELVLYSSRRLLEEHKPVINHTKHHLNLVTAVRHHSLFSLVCDTLPTTDI